MSIDVHASPSMFTQSLSSVMGGLKPMPLWNLDIQKEFSNVFWTNRYILDAVDLAAAVNAANVALTGERQVHSNQVLFNKFRVSDRVQGTDVYQIVQVNEFGQVVKAGYIPLFNVVRVDFNVAGGGRPSRKYLRIPLAEGDVINGNLEAALITAIETNYVAPLVTAAAYVDVDGQDWISGQVMPRIGMRQLRRGSRRSTQPIIPG